MRLRGWRLAASPASWIPCCAACLLVAAVGLVPSPARSDDAAAAARRFVYIVRPVPDEIKLDGELKPEEWQTAVPVAGFRTSPGGALVRNQTLVRVLYDWEALYIGVTCYEGTVDKILSAAPEGSAAILNDDCVEWSLGVGAKPETVLQMAANPAGAKLASTGKDTPWVKAWQVAVKKGKGSWSVEAKIPFESLGTEMPKLLDVWCINIVRHRRADLKEPEVTVWADVPAPPAQACEPGRLLFIQQPMPAGVSPFDGLTEKVGGLCRVFGDVGYVDVDGARIMYRYSDLLGASLSDEMGTAKLLADMKQVIDKQPEHPQADRYWHLARQWDNLVRDVQAAQVANALAWSWGTMDIGELSANVADLAKQVKAP